MNPFFNTIEQPVLMLDEDQAKQNIRFMVDKALKADVQFRPHFKTHQSAIIGSWFFDMGVRKITVSSVDMAEYFADNGWTEITIAFSVNPRQVARLKRLAERVQLSLLVESVDGVRALDGIAPAQAEVWIKIDVGAHRTGMDWTGIDAVRDVCGEIRNRNHLKLAGLLTHSGHTYAAHSKQEIIALFREGVERLISLKSRLAVLGYSDLRISVGDTPGCTLCDDFQGVDEIRPGNFIFYDVHQFLLGVCTFDQIAVAAACPVVALHPERDEVVIYGGAIHLSKDLNIVGGIFNYGLISLPGSKRWGEQVEGAFVSSLSQEHGIVHYPHSAMDAHPLKVGDIVFVLPAHSCLTVQALGEYHTLDGIRIPTMLKQ